MSAVQERWPAVRVEPKQTSTKDKADEGDLPLVQADLDKIKASPPSNKITRAPLWTSPHPPSKPASQKVVIGILAQGAMTEEHRKTKTFPPKPTYFEQASINLKPVTAVTIQQKPLIFQQRTSLRSTTKTEPETGQRTRRVVKHEQKN